MRIRLNARLIAVLVLSGCASQPQNVAQQAAPPAPEAGVSLASTASASRKCPEPRTGSRVRPCNGNSADMVEAMSGIGYRAMKDSNNASSGMKQE